MDEKKNTIYTYEEAFEASKKYFDGDELAAKVFVDKYALRDREQNILEDTPVKMFERIATEIARIEKKKFKKPMSYEEIYDYIKDFKYIVPQGGLLSGIGNKYRYTSLSSCFVISSPLDSYPSICKTDEEIVNVSRRRGGVGFDISNLRPIGSITQNASMSSTGIVPFCERFSNTIREVGQCLYEKTLILTKNGLKEIKEIKEGEKVWTKEKWVKVNKIIKNKKKCKKVKTKFGREIICSENHVFHTVDGEKIVKKMEIGDLITQIIGEGWDIRKETKLLPLTYKRDSYNNSNRLNIKITLPNKLNKEISYILGYSYGDGNVYKHSKSKIMNGLRLASSNDWKDIKKKLTNYINKVFNYFPKIQKPKNSNYEVITIFSRIVLEFLKENQILKQKAGELIFPKIFLGANTENIFSFLSGYLDADGCVLKSKKCYKFSSIDKDFLLIIQNILSSYGIISKLHKTDRKKYGWNDIYNLTINGNESQKVFRKLMIESIKINTYPFFGKKRDFTRTIYKIKDFNTVACKYNYIMTENQYISYSTSQRLLEDLGIEKDIFLLQDYIKEIEDYKEGKKQNVYDLCLEEEHFFYANGFYVHNSGRRGALILTISVHHPEILNFINMKKDLKKITGANISVKLTDEFLEAVKKEEKYEQRFPVDGEKKDIKISNMVDAIKIWDEIVFNNRNSAEPGVLIWNNIIKESVPDCYSDFGFKSTSVNPCAEIILSKMDSCRLLLLNLYSFIEKPFTKEAKFNFDKFYKYSQIAQRFMDNTIDLEIECIDNIMKKINRDPEPIETKRDELNLWKKIKKTCLNGRRTGTGINAIGDTIAACNIKYGSKESIEFIDKITRVLKLGCYRSSVDIAKELGPFPVWNHELEKNNPFLLRIKDEDEKLWKDMKKYGRRNIGLLTISPSGSVSILTRTTSGIEPLFKINYKRRKKISSEDKNSRVDFIDNSGDRWQEFEVYHPKVLEWKRIAGEEDITKSPWYGCCAEEINWKNRVKLQAVANKNIDHSIASTINLPENATVGDVSEIYKEAWKQGVKGITVYRKNSRTGVLIDSTGPSITKTIAPKRPEVLNCDVHHVSVKKIPYFVIVSFLNKDVYEVFAGVNVSGEGEIVIPRNIDKGSIKKMKRGRYDLYDINRKETIRINISKFIDEEHETITRLISSNLRHGCDVNFVVHQLEKTTGDLMGFSKAICRVLKRYIAENSAVHGEECPECNGELRRVEGCVSCINCGFSKC